MSTTPYSIKELVDLIRYHSEIYYAGTPEISDAEFDDLIASLRALDPTNSVLKEVGASVGSSGTFRKITHKVQMGSLDKVNTLIDSKSWYFKNCPKNTIGLLGTLKIDGCALSVSYLLGELNRAVTRGDGVEGQDVTANVMQIRSIKNTGVVDKDGKSFTGEIRGEIYMPISTWKSLEDTANPRNAAVGSLLQKDAKITGQRGLKFFAYDIISETKFKTETEKLAYIASLGFEVIEHTDFDNWVSDDAIESWIAMWENDLRQQLDYQIDGLVFYLNDIALQDELGFNGKCPIGKIAYKFKPEQKVSKLKGVNWFTGRTGRVTPVASIEPVQLAGTTVSNVSIYNYKMIGTLGIKSIGDELLIAKAGDIIPTVVRLVKNADPIVGNLYPKNNQCPSCESELVLEDVNIWCKNKCCPAQFEAKALHYLNTLGVVGIGPAIVTKLCTSGTVKKLSDLYNRSAVEKTLGGGRSAEVAWSAIDSVHNVNLEVFLDSLGIDGLGTTTSKVLAKKFETIEVIRNRGLGDFIGLEGIGSLTAGKIYRGLLEMGNDIDELLSNGFIKLNVKIKTSGNLNGRTFVLTGAMPSGRTRDEVEKTIHLAGGETKSSVGRNVQYLVQADGDSSSGKSVKARSLGIKIISEEDLIRMIKS